MPNISVEINGKKHALSGLWVHLQDDEHCDHSDFTIRVPNEHLCSVFDPYKAKPEGQLWSEYISTQIQDLGTFIVEGYIKLMMGIMNDKDVSYSWVLSSISELCDTEDAIEIKGRVLPFRPTE